MILFLIVLLTILMLLVGGDKGAISFITLILNFIIGMTAIYLLGIGLNPVILFIISSLLFCQVTLVYQNGFHKKTVVSYLSVFVVLGIMGCLIFVIGQRSQLYGMNDIERIEENMRHLSKTSGIKMLPIFMVSMLWAELGAIMDTSISISSPMQEIILHQPQITKKQLLKSGMRIGKDIIGTTVNTLTFVALGESIMLIIYYLACQYTIERLLCSKAFLQQIAMVLFSCTGCILIIPVTAFLFVKVNASKRWNRYFEKIEKKQRQADDFDE